MTMTGSAAVTAYGAFSLAGGGVSGPSFVGLDLYDCNVGDGRTVELRH